ncbi:MAG: lysozyme [Flavobacterium sp.]
MKINRISQRGLNLIQRFEGLSLKPYKCPAGIWTIGYGTTFYTNGIKVKETDNPISQAEATNLLIEVLKHYEQSVDSFCRDDISQNQFDALVSFCYNVGAGSLKSSTLLKKVNVNPNDETISAEFMKWNKGGGKVLKGLTERRKAEADLYVQL